MGSYISKGVGGVMEKNMDMMKEQQQIMVIFIQPIHYNNYTVYIHAVYTAQCILPYVHCTSFSYYFLW